MKFFLFVPNIVVQHCWIASSLGRCLNSRTKCSYNLLCKQWWSLEVLVPVWHQKIAKVEMKMIYFAISWGKPISLDQTSPWSTLKWKMLIVRTPGPKLYRYLGPWLWLWVVVVPSSVSRAVASDTRDLQFASSHREILLLSTGLKLSRKD